MGVYERDPSEFSKWIRKNLMPATSGLIAQDIDYVIFLNMEPHNSKFLLLEEKVSERAKIPPPQAIIAKMLDDIFSGVCGNLYLGYFLVYSNPTGLIKIFNSLINFEEFISALQSKVQFFTGECKWFERIIEKNFDKLWDCIEKKRTFQKTERERSFKRISYLHNIIEKAVRKKNFFYISIDWIILNYCTGFFILLTEKSFFDEGYKAIDIYFQKYNLMCDRKELVVKNPRSNVVYKYLGLYNLSFNPQRSIQFLNSKKVETEQLIDLLNLTNDFIKQYRIF